MEYIVLEDEDDGLFDDRLHTFCDSLSKQIDAFAARENKPVDEVPFSFTIGR